MEKQLDYIATKEYVLGIKVEDSAQESSRKSAQAQLTIAVVFVPTGDSSDPNQLTEEIQITFPDMDYDATVVGNEDAIISSLNDSLTEENPDALFIHFQLTKGSVIATFEMITRQSKTNSALNNIASGVTLTHSNGQSYKTDDNMKVKNHVYKTTKQTDKKEPTMVT